MIFNQDNPDIKFAFQDEFTDGEKVELAVKRFEEETADAIDPSTDLVNAKRNYHYPEDIKSGKYPAKIVFTAVKVEGLNIAKEIGETFESITALFGRNAQNTRTGEEPTSSTSDSKVTEEQKRKLAEDVKKQALQFNPYENKEIGEKVGRVTLPLMRDLRFSDNANYETPNLGVLGGPAEAMLQGGNPFAGATDNGKLAPTISALAANVLAKSTGEIVGGALGAVGAGGAGAVLGATVLGGADEGISGAVRSATRIASAPNQRTLFQNVNLRSFAFTFKMVANNKREMDQIRNIVKFFREELYPEKISLGESGVPLGYEFPNMFDIDIINRDGSNPAFNIQRCYLRDVQTSFNGTSSGMYYDGNFIEVDISLQFQETVALDKAKVKNKGY